MGRFLVLAISVLGADIRLFAQDTVEERQQIIANGETDARADFQKHVFRIEKYGLRLVLEGVESDPYEKYLQEYGVEFKTIGGGCDPNSPEALHAQGYNKVMEKLIIAKYQRDIFQEARDYLQIYLQGVSGAKKDFADGIYKEESYGMGSEWSTERSKYLQEKYQVVCKGVAGCVVTPKILGHAQGYNATMQKLLREKYGKDIFKEADDFARQQTGR
ncbi:MAG: hypothetical protein LBH01_05765 [Verrucomicrobiales bacterium]|jgi:hypothetical protein|nr:hypothetical protein [Verrucomicrobiales bacterium]